MIYDERKLILSREFGIMYAHIKFKEIIFLEEIIKEKELKLKNYPESYEFIVKKELLKIHDYRFVHFDYFLDICLLAYIEEGYRLKETYKRGLNEI